MNLATGSLTLLGLAILLLGVASKIMGLSLLTPFFSRYSAYLAAANCCFLLVLIVDKFQKR